MTRKVAFYTLGCRVNHYETRAVEETFVKNGFTVGSFDEKCDVYVINTCTVTAESDRKSRQLIRRARTLGGENAVVAALGCMIRTDRENAAIISEADILLDNTEKMRCVDEVLKRLDPKGDETTCPPDGARPMTVTGADTTRAFLKIADGCDNACAYCIIPKARGPVTSRPMKEVLDEAGTLVAAGYREIVLTGIETAAYGKDLPDGEDLVSLVEKVDTLPLDRIRLGSIEPSFLKEDAAARLAACKHFMPHIHLSLQSGSSGTLARMRRKYNAEQFRATVERLKKHIPELLVTTDIIVGFPGETEEAFEETCRMVEDLGFSFCHIFPYSDRAGTAASVMPDKVPERVKKDRAARLKTVMLETRRKVLENKRGKTADILVETVENGVAAGHTPDFIETRFPADASVRPNTLVTVTLLDASDDLAFVYGEPHHDR